MKLVLFVVVFGFVFMILVVVDKLFIYFFDGLFDDVIFVVESVIVGQGLVIDYVSYVGDMFNCIGVDVGSDVVIFKNVDIFLFCFVVVFCQVMEKDLMNIEYCLYGIFVIEMDVGVQIGYKDYFEGLM